MELNDEINELSTPEPSNDLVLTQTAQYYLQQTSKWTKFLSIMGFIGAALMALLGILISAGMSAMSAFSSAFPAPFGALMGVFYILTAVFYFYASLYLYRFGESVKTGVLFNDALQIEEGFGKLKSLFKMMGITTIVFLVLYVLIFIGTLIFLIFVASHGR